MHQHTTTIFTFPPCSDTQEKWLQDKLEALTPDVPLSVSAGWPSGRNQSRQPGEVCVPNGTPASLVTLLVDFTYGWNRHRT